MKNITMLSNHETSDISGGCECKFECTEFGGGNVFTNITKFNLDFEISQGECMNACCTAVNLIGLCKPTHFTFNQKENPCAFHKAWEDITEHSDNEL